MFLTYSNQFFSIISLLSMYTRGFTDARIMGEDPSLDGIHAQGVPMEAVCLENVTGATHFNLFHHAALLSENMSLYDGDCGFQEPTLGPQNQSLFPNSLGRRLVPEPPGAIENQPDVIPLTSSVDKVGLEDETVATSQSQIPCQFRFIPNAAPSLLDDPNFLAYLDEIGDTDPCLSLDEDTSFEALSDFPLSLNAFKVAQPSLPYASVLNRQGCLETSPVQDGMLNHDPPTRGQQDHGNNYRSIQAKPMLSFESTIPALHRQGPTDTTTAVYFKNRTSYVLGPRPRAKIHKAGRSKAGLTIVDKRIPHHFLHNFHSLPNVPAGEYPETQVAKRKRKRSKKGAKKCLRCEVTKQTVSFLRPCSTSITTKLQYSVMASSLARTARGFGKGLRLASISIKLAGVSAQTQIFLSLISSLPVSLLFLLCNLC